MSCTEMNSADNYQYLHRLLLKQTERIAYLEQSNDRLTSNIQQLKKEIGELENRNNDLVYVNELHIETEQKLQQQLTNLKNTKSFRLSQALVACKSFKGFKNLFKTVFVLMKEKNDKKKTSVFNNAHSNVSNKVSKVSKVSNYWQTFIDIIEHNTEFDYISDRSMGDVLKLEKTQRVSFIKDFQQYEQIIIVVNVFGDYAEVQKQAVMTVDFFDSKENKIQQDNNLYYSKQLDSYYWYLNACKTINDCILIIKPDNAVKFKIGFTTWDNKSDIYLNNSVKCFGLLSGISVILPVYKGEKYIVRCLESLQKQTLPHSLFEILVVINGEKDNTLSLIKEFQKNSDLNIKVYQLEEGNVSKARNLAIYHSERCFTTFIDVDDCVDHQYLEAMYNCSKFDTITITGIEDIIEIDGTKLHSKITDQLTKAYQLGSINYFDVTSSLTMNACKLVPTHMAKNFTYHSNLKSGEDVVYWCEIIQKFMPKIKIIDDYSKITYKRLLTQGSVSRKKESYNFNVYDRLLVINHLIKLLNECTDEQIKSFIQSKINAQSNFIVNYLTKNRKDYAQFIDHVNQFDMYNSFISNINAKLSDTLVISYCFTPFIDQSAIVMNKRINEFQQPVDVISNNMDKIRKIDDELFKISYYYVGNNVQLNAPQTFGNWKAIEKFVDLTLDAVHQLTKRKKIYKTVYSRAMFPASHFAAAALKQRYPQMKWVAEFSDPILVDIAGKHRYEEMSINWLIDMGFIAHNDKTEEKCNMFEYCEKLAYLHADELIFTNENQLQYMLSYTNNKLHTFIKSKAKIKPQPTLNEKFYHLSNAQLEKNDQFFNIAYFGSFYVNRGFTTFFDVWKKLPAQFRNRIKLHIYTNQDSEKIFEQVPEILSECVKVQGFVDYFDFLALSNQFDALIVMDTQTKGLKINNPYLPSKISDYLGSSAKIFALVEEGSAMSKIESEQIIKARMDQSREILEQLKNLLA